MWFTVLRSVEADGVKIELSIGKTVLDCFSCKFHLVLVNGKLIAAW
jgi:hypothetical protein